MCESLNPHPQKWIEIKWGEGDTNGLLPNRSQVTIIPRRYFAKQCFGLFVFWSQPKEDGFSGQKWKDQVTSSLFLKAMLSL